MDDYDDVCFECGIYGYDYYTDEDGEFVSACITCPFNPFGFDEDD